MCNLPGMVVEGAEEDASARGNALFMGAAAGKSLPPDGTPESIGRNSSYASTMTPSGAVFVSEAWSSELTGEVTSDVSRSHLDLWMERDETLIMFDWDDTLCPTSHLALAPFRSAADPRALERHTQAVQELLRVAASCGRVAILSMAGPGWIEDTVKRSMPQLSQTLEALDISVSLARVGVPRVSLKEAFAEARNTSHFLKRRTMGKLIKSFYTPRVGRSSKFRKQAEKARSWKNIISVGDSEAERLALQDIAMSHQQRDRNGKWKEFRCKTVKLMSEPTLAQLTEQVRVLTTALPALVMHDGDFDYEMENGDLPS